MKTTLLTAACLLVLGTAFSVKANAQAPLEVSVAVSGSSKISLDEPLLLHYRVTNISDSRNITIGLGYYKNGWYDLNLTDANGQSVQVIPHDTQTEPRGFHYTGTHSLQPTKFEEDSIVVTRHLRLRHPGKYNLTVKAHLPYIDVTGTEGGGLARKLYTNIASSHETLAQTFTFPITVTELNSAQLEAKAREIAQTATTEKDQEKYCLLLDTLFTIPETQAISSWTTLTDNPSSMNVNIIAGKLSEVHSIKTIDLLIKMLDSPALTADQAAYLRQRVDESYNASNTTVKAHVKEVAAKRGLTMPEKVVTPMITD